MVNERRRKEEGGMNDIKELEVESGEVVSDIETISYVITDFYRVLFVEEELERSIFD